MLIPNHWRASLGITPMSHSLTVVSRSIGRDPELWPDGDDFKPGRWLDSEGHVQEEYYFPNFGFGRR
jgi:cytochrome P450